MRPRKILLLSGSLATLIFTSAWLATGQAPRRVDDAMIRSAGKSGEEWLSYNLTPGETRYSPLKQINTTNVGKLAMAWSYDIPFGGGGTQEATPLVHDGVMYSVTNWTKVFAVDARTGKEKWRFDAEVNQETVRPKICCGIVNRGLAIYENTIIASALDGRLIALDMATGKPVWEARVAWAQDNYTMTMAPRIAKGKVIVGVGGAEFPVRGFFAAFDAKTGKEAWKFYTVPGDPAKGYESEELRKAAATWNSDSWKLGGGGTVWDGMAYDPDEELVYVGTGNAGPWPENLRMTQGKDALYASSILAVNVNTGKLKWYFQVVPGDSWDYDSVAQLMLADLTINGRQRKVIMQANKNGFYYVIDRVTGEFISGKPYAKVTWASGLDEKTGRPIVHPEALYTKSESISVTPGPGGAHNWPPMSFNPTAGLVYIPGSSGTGFSYQVDPVFEYKPNQMNLGINLNTGGGGGGDGNQGKQGKQGKNAPNAESPEVAAARAAAAAAPPPPPAPVKATVRPTPPAIGPNLTGSFLFAWDPVTQTEKWHKPGGGSGAGGTLSTGGNLVFQTLPDGRLMAYSADKGDDLLELRMPVPNGVGPPMTFQIDGKQYIAVMGGQGPGQPQGFGGGTAPNPKGPPPPAPKLMVFAVQ
ncbi:MAG: PQQ-dependent dehydrogenase, methanol/ethanol family [Acidobacteriota bacterium]